VRLISILVVFLELSLTTANASPLEAWYSEAHVKKAISVPQISKTEIILSPETGLRMHKNTPYTGDVVSYYPTGELYKLERFKQGLRQDFLKQWFKSGVLSFHANYHAGVQQGKTTSWWGNGMTRSETTFIAGQVNGLSLQWYATGQRFKKMNYRNGKEVGLQQAWRKTVSFIVIMNTLMVVFMA